MKKLFFLFGILFLGLILSGWGYKGHRIISSNAANSFPTTLSFLKPNWTNIVTNYASEADYRKDTDPTEAPRHYINIDGYPEFLLNGAISQSLDTNILLHGCSFVLDHGIIPWATLATFDSLRACFERHDWLKSALFAADLGHYVGDGHQPLHITENYNGQFTGQDGIHSRYESSMISRNESQLVYPSDTVHFIANVKNYIFSYIYFNHLYVDSILMADLAAKSIAGNTTSTAYYQAMWDKTGAFTIDLLRRGSNSLADLIYTAWVQAGSPVFYPLAVEETTRASDSLALHNFPNPCYGQTTIEYEVYDGKTPVTILIYDPSGKLKNTLVNQVQETGRYRLIWNADHCETGIYLCVLKSGSQTVTRKIALIR
ncbi:MAG: T9SS type A sorting domain-containing protein [Bacteroidales bacterium]|nr:T9SS type A sorting domain-containing protein [Bacteroidales bacterium]